MKVLTSSVVVVGLTAISWKATQQLRAAPLPEAGVVVVERPSIKAIVVKERLLKESFEVVGTLEPWMRIEVSAPVSGTIAQLGIPTDDGTTLQIGQALLAKQTIAAIDSSKTSLELEIAKSAYRRTFAQYKERVAGTRQEDLRRLESDVRAAKVKWQQAQDELERTKRLHAANSVSAVDVDRNEAAAVVQRMELTTAEAELQKARSGATVEELDVLKAQVAADAARIRAIEFDLKQCTILAPRDGVVTAIYAQIGEHVDVGAPVAEIMDIRRLIAVIEVDSRHVNQLRHGDSVAVVARDSGTSAQGTILAINRKLNARTRQFTVRVVINEPPIDLMPGMFVNVQLTPQSRGPVPSVPVDSIVWRDGVASVFVVEGDVIRRRVVRLGTAQDGRVAIISGLESGEAIAINPSAAQMSDEMSVAVDVVEDDG